MSLNHGLHTEFVFAAGLLAAMLACMEVGFRIGRGGDAALEGKESGLIEGAIFAPLPLLVAFTLSGAAGRIDQRRALILDEANAVGTAYLRLSLLPATVRKDALRRPTVAAPCCMPLFVLWR